ncbi:MAG: NADH-quinone oxidoreductase subunit NuoE [Candidatus Latescibacteria bacterium]|nr:NADH-quinone oxidoreductase subunit NuoE [Candidatus Latescibacterota bacterium]
MSPLVVDILERFPGARRDSLIPILQAVQEQEGFLSQESVLAIGRHLDLPASKVYGVATFYNQFRFTPIGRFHVQVCRGTACHVKGSANVLDAVERDLGVKAGGTTRDGLFSLEVVACIGACGLAPVIAVGGDFHAGVAPRDVPGIFASYRERAKEGGSDAA